jgi:hypothetical protein
MERISITFIEDVLSQDITKRDTPATFFIPLGHMDFRRK